MLIVILYVICWVYYGKRKNKEMNAKKPKSENLDENLKVSDTQKIAK